MPRIARVCRIRMPRWPAAIGGNVRQNLQSRGTAAQAQSRGAASQSGAERMGNRQVAPSAPGRNRSAFGGVREGRAARMQSDHGYSSLGPARSSGGRRPARGRRSAEPGRWWRRRRRRQPRWWWTSIGAKGNHGENQLYRLEKRPGAARVAPGRRPGVGGTLLPGRPKGRPADICDPAGGRSGHYRCRRAQ